MLFNDFSWLNAKPEVLIKVFFFSKSPVPSRPNLQGASCSPVAEETLRL